MPEVPAAGRDDFTVLSLSLSDCQETTTKTLGSIMVTFLWLSIRKIERIALSLAWFYCSALGLQNIYCSLCSRGGPANRSYQQLCAVEKTPRACISTGAILSLFGKPLLYYSLVCGVVDRPHQYHGLSSLSSTSDNSFILFFTTI